MYPLLAGLDPSADEVPDHAWTIQFSPWDHPEQFCDLLQVLGLLRSAVLLRNQPHVAQGDCVRLFVDVEPLLVPFIQRGVPGAVQVLGLYAITKIEVDASGYLRAAAPFLPQTEQMAKEVKMGLEATICFTKMDEGGDKKN